MFWRWKLELFKKIFKNNNNMHVGKGFWICQTTFLLLKFTKVKEFVKGKYIVSFFESSMTLREWVLKVLKGMKVVFSLAIKSTTHSSKPYYCCWTT
jgi:hypothetical protein